MAPREALLVEYGGERFRFDAYQTYLKQVVFKQALADIEQAQSVLLKKK